MKTNCKNVKTGDKLKIGERSGGMMDRQLNFLKVCQQSPYSGLILRNMIHAL